MVFLENEMQAQEMYMRGLTIRAETFNKMRKDNFAVMAQMIRDDVFKMLPKQNPDLKRIAVEFQRRTQRALAEMIQ